jgi:hypothetical protein
MTSMRRYATSSAHRCRAGVPGPGSFLRIALLLSAIRTCTTTLDRLRLYFAAFRRILSMQTRLSASVAVSKPAGGEMSGLTAHFLFGKSYRRGRESFSLQLLATI